MSAQSPDAALSDVVAEASLSVGAAIDGAAEKPHLFLLPDSLLSSSWLAACSRLYALAKPSEPYGMSPLSELLTDGCDLEQIWEQLQLQNTPMLKFVAKEAERVVAAGDLPTPEPDFDDDWRQGAREVDGREDGGLEGENVSGSDLGGESDVDAFSETDFAMDNDLDEEDLSGQDSKSTRKRMREEADSDDEGADEGADGSDVDADDGGGEEDDEDELDEVRPRGRVTEVDDEFFSVEEMERFAEEGEARDLARADGKLEENDPWNLGTDLFSMDPDEIEGSDDEDNLNANDIRYEDFFLPPQKLRTPNGTDADGKSGKTSVRFKEGRDEQKFDKDKPPSSVNEKTKAQTQEVGKSGKSGKADKTGTSAKKMQLDLLEDTLDDTEESGSNLSRFEKAQLKMQEEIKKLETEALSEKAWTLKGEVSAKARPMNSLLEEYLDVEHANRPVPVITEETTLTLEELIKSRIRDSLFNDVERKIDTRKKKEFDPNRRPLIDETKSSKSLAEEYESEYLRQTTGGAKAKTAKDLALQKSHDEVEGLLKELYHDLDALSNWHFKPQISIPELEVKAKPNVPALTMEEVIPAVVSDATQAAPQDVYAGKVAKSQSEMEKADKKRERLRQKRVHKKQRLEKAKEQKSKEEAGIVVSKREGKEKAMATLRKQRNVTIIDDASGRLADTVNGKKKKKGQKSGAKIIKRGDALGADDRASARTGSMLRL
ncbi:U3 small nucleolar ribonucleoprotein complex, subunit Mpp10 [Zopfochytrium polystomum]|nr:U3 small nucleolar ribonucleoprotein complex, subunit Mpp10 [Zopfochytrium polystomum]